MEHIEADYLVAGGGATAMAFVDTLLDEAPEATVAIVDRHAAPGGHWNDAYPFVRLHQPSAMYGVASRPLGRGTKDVDGNNAGLSELAAGAEVLAHYAAVLHERFLPSGRVRWFPRASLQRGADGGCRIVPLDGGAARTAAYRRKFVDATHARTEVPATHPPRYALAPGLPCVSPTGLAALDRLPTAVTVVGGGKTGIDTCLWLLAQGLDPGAIRWIVPRDAWFMDRALAQPGREFLAAHFGALATQLEAVAAADSLPDLLRRLEAGGQLLRLDPRVEPQAYRCATVTAAELEALRRIGDVVRLGRVRAIEPGRVVLERGERPAAAGMVYVDCSSDGIPPPPPVPVFAGETVNLLMVRTCQPAFSAALIAFVEARVAGADADEANRLCAVVPSPREPADWLRMWAVTVTNRHRWGRHEALLRWVAGCRLDTMAGVIGAAAAEPEVQALVRRWQAALKQAVPRFNPLLAGA